MSVAPFVFAGLPARVLFGPGRLADAKNEAERLGMRRALVVTGKRQAALGAQVAQRLDAATFDGAVMHTPIAVTEGAMAVVRAESIDGIVSIGGGSAIGLGKALALRTDLPQLCVPTTYAGSEMTPILGETAGGSKTTRRDPRIQPETVLYDPELTRTLPDALAATSGLNALAHAVEALYAPDANPITSLMAEEGIRALARALPLRAAARDEALYGAWLCGGVLGATQMSLHHKLCHVLGGTFELPHSETHAVLLPHAVAYNAPAASDAIGRVARALSVPVAAAGIFDLSRALGAPASLEAIGMRHADLDRAADVAAQNPYANPRPVTRDGVRALLEDAFRGRRPE
jgi:alcohol dehydrogenase class IV